LRQSGNAEQKSPVASESKLVPPVNASVKSEDRRADPAQMKKIQEAFQTPISFYGKVVDEAGSPVPNAAIKLSPTDKPWSETSTYHDTTSDVQGLFSLTGAHGIDLAVWVTKEGYYSTAKSKGIFAYGGAATAADKARLPAPDRPAIFVLKKMGATVPLVHLDRRSVVVPKNGKPIEIDLASGAIVPVGKGNFRVEVWTHDGVKDVEGRYDWRCRVSVPGGGLAERGGTYDFEAPLDAYLPSVELSMPSTAPRWRDDATQEYFARLADGRFVRFYFRILTGGAHFFQIESFLNPERGNRNLEFDKSKVAAGVK
jgi:hypothetical protein